MHYDAAGRPCVCGEAKHWSEHAPDEQRPSEIHSQMAFTPLICWVGYGADNRDRTGDLLITNLISTYPLTLMIIGESGIYRLNSINYDQI